jgi:hypothetical protein
MRHITLFYYATEDGHIYSSKSRRLITERLNNKGYKIVNLSIDGKCKTFSVHRLIAQAYIPNPDNLPTINHKNGIKTDNRIENLEWVTFSENTTHAVATGLLMPAKGRGTKNGRFEDEDIKRIKELYSQGLSQYKIAEMYNVTRGTIQQILNGHTYSYVN